jgi:hypothetical protein
VDSANVKAFSLKLGEPARTVERMSQVESSIWRMIRRSSSRTGRGV